MHSRRNSGFLYHYDIFVEIIRCCLPASLGSFLSMLQETINLIFIGQMNDPVKLAAVGMGNMIVNMFGVGTYFGLNSALETLVS